MAEIPPRFLTLAVQRGKLTEQQRVRVLDEQKSLPAGQFKRVGDICQERHYLNRKTCDELAEEQKKYALERRGRLPRHAPLLVNQHPLIAILAVATVAALVKFRDWTLVDATTVVSFVAAIISWLLEYRASGNFFRALTRFLIVLGVVSALSVIGYTAWGFSELSQLAVTHPATRNGMERWVMQMKLAIVAPSLAFLVTFLYAMWKYHSLKAAESRLSVFKDVLTKIRLILEEEGTSIEARQITAINYVVKKLQFLMGMNTPDVLMRRLMVTSVRPGANAVGVFFFRPDKGKRRFDIVSAAFPDRVDERVKEAFNWIKDNHKPVFLDEEKFEKRKELAKGRNPKGWKERFLSFHDRNTYISVCGWIYEKTEELKSKDASKCLAFDDTFIVEVAKRFDNDVQNWIQVRAFMGKRVYSPAGQRAGVLLVTKNAGNGFSSEDDQLLKIASEIIGLVFHFEGVPAVGGADD